MMHYEQPVLKAVAYTFALIFIVILNQLLRIEDMFLNLPMKRARNSGAFDVEFRITINGYVIPLVKEIWIWPHIVRKREEVFIAFGAVLYIPSSAEIVLNVIRKVCYFRFKLLVRLNRKNIQERIQLIILDEFPVGGNKPDNGAEFAGQLGELRGCHFRLISQPATPRMAVWPVI